MNDLHPVKQESFCVKDGTNIDPKGFTRQVDAYRETPFGLYMGRAADHPDFGYLESWLLPQLGLRVNKFHQREGVNKYKDFYIDVADITVKDGQWHTRDLYIDLLSTVGQPIDVEDIDELATATASGVISSAEAERAIERTLAAVEGITRHGDDPMQWLQAIDAPLEWAENVELAPAG